MDSKEYPEVLTFGVDICRACVNLEPSECHTPGCRCFLMEIGEIKEMLSRLLIRVDFDDAPTMIADPLPTAPAEPAPSASVEMPPYDGPDHLTIRAQFDDSLGKSADRAIAEEWIKCRERQLLVALQALAAKDQRIAEFEAQQRRLIVLESAMKQAYGLIDQGMEVRAKTLLGHVLDNIIAQRKGEK
jgi:hypothetical protein